MALYGIQPSVSSYAFLIEVSGKKKEIKKSEAYYDQSVALFGWNVFSSNAMIFAYAKNNSFDKAMNIFKLSKLYGLK